MITATKERPLRPKHHVALSCLSAMPPQHGADHARQVELDGVQRDGVGQVLGFHQTRDQRRIRGPAERLRQPHHERQREDLPHLDVAHRVDDGEGEGTGHLNVLRTEQQVAAFDAVGHGAADQREQENRNLAQKRIEPQKEARFRKVEYQPRLSHDLHERSHAGRAGAEEHHTEIAILKGLECALEQGSPFRGAGSAAESDAGNCRRHR